MLNLLPCPECEFALERINGIIQCPICGHVDEERTEALKQTAEVA